MPLKHGKSEKSFKENIKTEMHHGKPQKQAVAIAYAVRRKAQHKAKGGLIPGVEHPHKGEPMNKKLHPHAHGGPVQCAHGGPDHCAHGCYAEGGEVKEAPEESLGEKIDKGIHNLKEAYKYSKKHPKENKEDHEEMHPAPISKEEADKFSHSILGYSHGGEIHGEEEHHEMRPDYEDELEDEPMGNSWHSDEFLADPYGEMESNHHVEFDPDVEEEEGIHDEMKPNPKKRLETIMARRRIHGIMKK
jgi:hypothetical protein